MLEGTQVKVIEVALDHLAYGWTAEQIHRQHLELSLGQIHSALAYYHDHQREMDSDIEKDYREVKRIRAELGDTAIQLKLKAMARLP
jgi:uncharacterized protein (DUF433 family)